MSSADLGQALTKNQFAYREARRRIIMGELPPGEPIPQARLAADLGVSLTPLREALRKLDAEGLVEFASHKDVRPTMLTAAGARDLYEIRRHLEPHATRLGAERRTDADADAIERAAAELVPLTGDSSLEAMLAHRAFHRALYGASHNRELVTVLDGLWDKADRYRRLGMNLAGIDQAERLERVRRQHTALADAVVAGDPDAAERVSRKHIDSSLTRLVESTLA